MRWFPKALLILQTVLLGAALGGMAMFFGVILLGSLTGSSNINGGLAMGAAGAMPIGGVIGAAIGLWLGWRAATRWKIGTIRFAAYGFWAVVALGVGGFFVQRELTDGNPYPSDAEPVVLIEWRLPELVPHDQVDRRFRQMARSSYMDWILSDGWAEPRARDEDGVTILRMWIKIRWRVTGRSFQLWQWPNHDDRITVDLRLPKDPAFGGPFSEWYDVEGYPGHAFRTQVLGPE